MQILGIDIGGANIKVALRHSDKIIAARSYPFALWKHPGKLAGKLQGILAEYPGLECIAATMTGELCDCYATKAEGVAAIVLALDQAAENIPVRWWSTTGQFVGSATAARQWLEIAAANWSVAAFWVGKLFPGERALWLDIGSTTTDIICIQDGLPVTIGKTDPGRMRSGELIYAGVKRTPLCVLMGMEGAAEFFATTDDLFGLLGEVPEFPGDCDTADGRPRLREFRLARVARMLAADMATASEAEVLELARLLRDRMVRRIAESIRRLEQNQGGKFQRVVLSGSGEFFARLVAKSALGDERPRVEMSRRIGADGSSSLPAVALSQLLQPGTC